MNLNRHTFTQESRLARWFGESTLDVLKETSRQLLVPTPIMFTPDGDAIYAVQGHFLGAMRGGAFVSLADLRQAGAMGASVTGQRHSIDKVGTTRVADFCNSVWRAGNMPPAAAAAAALAAGTHNNNTTSGAIPIRAAAGGQKLHFIGSEFQSSASEQSLLLYDRLWNGLIALSSLAVQTCTLTGYPNSTGRYSAAPGESTGNFAFVANEAGATLSAVAHTWSMIYTDDAGNAAQAAAALAGISGAITNRIDHAGFAIPLLVGDYGVADIESIQCSVNTVAAGAPTIVLAHPIAILPCGLPQQYIDGVNAAFNLCEVKDNAALAFIELMAGATASQRTAGLVTIVEG